MGFSVPAEDAALVSAVIRAALDQAAPVGKLSGYCGTTAPTGWVLGAGKTIGSATSGATERANADTESLFVLLWNNYSNTELVIQDSSGIATTRGISGAADFAANKRMPTPDFRGRVLAGLDNMGGTSANRITPTEADTLGKNYGEETHTLDISEIPAHTHSGGATFAGGGFNSGGAGSVVNTGSAGGGLPHNNIQPSQFAAIIIKL